MYNRIRCIFFYCVLTVFLFTTTAWAGGLYIQEFATPSQGSANAGAQAWADNASTALFNPAAMTRIDGKELILSASLQARLKLWATKADKPNERKSK